jgi:hypothetical protein
MQKEVVVVNLKYYNGICLAGLRKTTNNLSQILTTGNTFFQMVSEQPALSTMNCHKCDSFSSHGGECDDGLL